MSMNYIQEAIDNLKVVVEQLEDEAAETEKAIANKKDRLTQTKLDLAAAQSQLNLLESLMEEPNE